MSLDNMDNMTKADIFHMSCSLYIMNILKCLELLYKEGEIDKEFYIESIKKLFKETKGLNYIGEIK